MEEVDRERLRADYMAVAQSNILKLLSARFGAELQMPNYSDILYPELKKRDERTAEQIKADILEKLEG